jgi:hypothetical protein
MRKKNSGLTVAGIAVVVVSIGLGIFFDFMKGPTCWHCWKSDNLTISGRQFVFLSSPTEVFHCEKCALVWRAGEPWNTLSFNPMADHRRHNTAILQLSEPPDKTTSSQHSAVASIELDPGAAP